MVLRKWDHTSARVRERPCRRCWRRTNDGSSEPETSIAEGGLVRRRLHADPVPSGGGGTAVLTRSTFTARWLRAVGELGVGVAVTPAPRTTPLPWRALR